MFPAVLVLLPLLLGEMVRTIRNARADWPVVASIVSAGLVVLCYLPLIGGDLRLTSHPVFPARASILWEVEEFVFTEAAVPLGLSFVALFVAMEAGGTPGPEAPGLSS